MNICDCLLIVGIVLALVGAVLILRKQKKNGSCRGDCSNCTGCH